MGEGKFETHSLSPLGVRTTEDLGAASQTLLAGGQMTSSTQATKRTVRVPLREMPVKRDLIRASLLLLVPVRQATE